MKPNFSGERITEPRASPAGSPTDGHGLVGQLDRLRGEPLEGVEPLATVAKPGCHSPANG